MLSSGARRATRRTGVVAATITMIAALLGPPGLAGTAHAAGAARSAYCHVSDGVFTTCPDTAQEWSDITPAEFPSRHAFLYADQADLVPDRGVPGLPVDTFMLMYDECGRTAPLGPDEYFLVSFDTVEKEPGEPEELVRYSVHIFPDGTLIFLENGEVQHDDAGRTRAAEIEGQTGRAGFGHSPRCAFDHLVVEYQIELEAAGGHSYSPDPLFWGGTDPNEAPTAADDEKDLQDQRSADIAVLANDIDPDGGIDPSTVAVAGNPGHGTIHIGASGVVTYEKGDDFDDTDEFTYTVKDDEGSVSNPATVTVFGNCATGRAIPATLPATTGTGVILSLAKGYRVSYDPLDLTLTTVAARQSAYCSLNTNVGVLKVNLTCLGTGASLCPDLFPRNVPIPIATSTATASLDFFRAGAVSVPGLCDFHFLSNSNNCLLNAGGGAVMARWHTDGFVMRDAFFGIPWRNTGPLTFWVNVSALVSADAPLATKVATVESYLHTTMVNHLSSIDWFSIIQDPPAEILVTDAAGHRTGRTESGEVVHEIPASVYSTSADGASMVLMLEPPGGDYQVKVHGTVGEQFTLSMASVDLYGDVGHPSIQEQVATGVLTPGGNDFTTAVPAEHRPPLSRAAIRPAFDTVELPANDDDSAGPVPLGFTADFFGSAFSDVYVNNNGNLTFGQALGAYTPFELSTTQRAIIAPFFADVDTHGGETVRYGTGVVGDRPAFGATWPGVRCFHDGGGEFTEAPSNAFQAILIDRGDIGPGDFDIEFNYDRIQWEAGTASGGDNLCRGGTAARSGFAKGTGERGTFFELPGSGAPGALLDTNAETGLIHHNLDARQPGRYVFAVRNGSPQVGDGDHDTVADDLDNCPRTVNADQHDGDLDGIGDACSPPGRLLSTAGFIQAGLDGQTAADPHAVALTDEPGSRERLGKIVPFRVGAGLATSAEELTDNLVDSLVESGLVPAAEADQLVEDVLDDVGSPPTCPCDPGTFVSLPPARVLDTRTGTGAPTGPVAPNGAVVLTVAGRGGVPSGAASAVVLNVTVTAPTRAGTITVYPSGLAKPLASNLNFVARQTVPNLVVVKLGADGKVVLANTSGGSVQLVADVAGYYLAGTPTVPGAFASLPPSRVLDTRTGTGAPTGPVAPNGAVALTVAGHGGVPSGGASAVVLNVTVTGPTRAGTITAYPSGVAKPLASNLNFVAGQTVPNLVVVKLGADGKVMLANTSGGSAQLVADVAGYFLAGTPTVPGAFVSLTPVRVLDTRVGNGAPVGAVAPNGSVVLTVGGRGVPLGGASAAVLNATVTGPTRAGTITVYPSGIGKPLASNLNFVAGQTVPNLVMVKIGPDGRVVLANTSSGSVQLVADLAGYYLR